MKRPTFRISDLLALSPELATTNGIQGEVYSLQLLGPDGSRYTITASETGGLRIDAGSYHQGGMVLQPLGHNSVILKQARIEDVK